MFADADFDQALSVVVKAIAQNPGQTCSAGSRVLVERAVYDNFVGRLAERFAALRVGTHDVDFDCGPLISAGQRCRVQRFLNQARANGVPDLAEGTFAPNLPSESYFSLPTLFGPMPRDNRLACEKVFGPLLTMLPFEDEDDAVAVANATDYGLVASIWRRDPTRQMRMARRLQCGQVFVNNCGAGGGMELPFDGVKHRGHGREKGFAAVHEFCTSKTVVFQHG